MAAGLWWLGVDRAEAARIGAVVAGLVALGAAAVLRRRLLGRDWVLAWSGVAVAALASVALGASALPDRSLLVPALAVAGAEAAVFGLVTGRRLVTALAPGFLCAAWLAYATEALTGNPEWVTVPIGVTLLVVGGLVQSVETTSGPSPSFGPLHRTLDVVGITFVVGAALVQTVTTSLWYGLLAVGLGVLVTGWGVVTRVRRRALLGAGTVVAAAILLVAVPIVAVTFPAEGGIAIRGASLWLAIAAIGLAVVVVAALLEQGRRRVRAVIRSVSELTRDWE